MRIANPNKKIFNAIEIYPDLGNPYTIASADFNNDGNLDLVAGNSNFEGYNSASLYLGDGRGKLTEILSVGDQDTTTTATADFNKDGNADLLFNGFEGEKVSVLLGNGDATFQPPINSVLTNFSSGLNHFTFGDFNKDGNIDIAASVSQDLPGSLPISVLLGEGTGHFELPKYFHPDPDSEYAFSWMITSGDFNHDGNIDLATTIQYTGAQGQEGSVSVLFGEGNGNFYPYSNLIIEGSPTPYAIECGDLNGDDNLDLVISRTTSNDVVTLLGSGDGHFNASFSNAVGINPESLILNDFDGDGILDAATANFGAERFGGDGDITVLFGDGTGDFQHIQTFPVYNDGKTSPMAIISGTLNSNNAPYLMVADYFNNVEVVKNSLAHSNQPKSNHTTRLYESPYFIAGVSLAGVCALGIGLFAAKKLLDRRKQAQDETLPLVQNEGHAVPVN